MTRPDTRLLARAVGARLAGVESATGYYAQIGRPLPTVEWPKDDPQRLGPLQKSTTDQRVRPYFLYTPAVQGPGPDPTVSGCDTGTVLRFTITAVGGEIDDLIAVVDRIESRLHRWTPVVSGHICGHVTHPLGYQPSTVITDRDVTPHRLFTAIPFEVAATT